MEWLTHPIVVATYVVFLGSLVAAAKGAARLWVRVGDVEKGVADLTGKVDSLACDLREHMADEGQNMARLEKLIRGIGRPGGE